MNKETRNLSELYKLVKVLLPTIYYRKYFICNVLKELEGRGIITYKELNKIFKDFEPRKKEAEEIAPEGYYGGEGWWHTEVLDSRIKFLDYLIDVHSKTPQK